MLTEDGEGAQAGVSQWLKVVALEGQILKEEALHHRVATELHEARHVHREAPGHVQALQTRLILTDCLQGLHSKQGAEPEADILELIGQRLDDGDGRRVIQLLAVG